MADASEPDSLFVAVDKDGTEWSFSKIPERMKSSWMLFGKDTELHKLQEFTIEAWTGKKMSWKDEPVEVFFRQEKDEWEE